MALDSPRVRAAVAAIAVLHALVLGAAASTLPWRALSWFAIASGVLAALHVATAATCVFAPRAAARTWRLTSAASLLYTVWWTVTGLAAALTLWRIYGSLGAGLGVALLAALGNIWLFGMPFAIWGLFATRAPGPGPTAASSRDGSQDPADASRHERTAEQVSDAAHNGTSAASRALLGGSTAILLAVFGLGALRGGSTSLAAEDVDLPLEDLSGTLASLPPPAQHSKGKRPGKRKLPRLSLAGLPAAKCSKPPTATNDATALVIYVNHDGNTRLDCVQSPPSRLGGVLDEHLRTLASRGPVLIERLVSSASIGAWSGPLGSRRRETIASPWNALDTLVAPFELKPGVDAACLGVMCIPATQLVAESRFVNGRPIAAIPDLRIGFSSEDLIDSLTKGEGELRGSASLQRVRTRAVVLGPEGARALDRGRTARDAAYPLDSFAGGSADRAQRAASRDAERHPSLRASDLKIAGDLARDHIVRAQGPDGKFRYQLDPYTGEARNSALVLPRQAGVTLALCELGGDRKDVDKAVRSSLLFMAARRRDFGSQHGLATRATARVADLGSSALPLLAFLTCRDRVGEVHDDLIAELGQLILALQRDDGGFAPGWERDTDAPQQGPDPLFAPGQAVFALILLHDLARTESIDGLPNAAELEMRARRAMRYFGERYAKHLMSDFFFVEENWHCLAARAALEHLREESYERFCLDYVSFKRRLLLREASRVDDAFVGGYGFGNLVAPQNTPTAGLAESMAAAHAIALARGEPTQALEQDLKLALDFLLRQQWRERDLFVASRPVLTRGGWSESMVSPMMRIDFTQHAWAAIGHGGAAIGPLLDPEANARQEAQDRQELHEDDVDAEPSSE